MKDSKDDVLGTLDIQTKKKYTRYTSIKKSRESPMKKDSKESALKRESSLKKEATSPVKKEASSPVKKEASPTKSALKSTLTMRTENKGGIERRATLNVSQQ